MIWRQYKHGTQIENKNANNYFANKKLSEKKVNDLKYVKFERISLKNHPIYNEKWVQGKINDDPSILGLGDLIVKDKERIQPTAGRLDLLLQSPLIVGRVEFVQFCLVCSRS